MICSNAFAAVYMSNSQSAPCSYAGHLYREAFQLPTAAITVGGLLLVVLCIPAFF